MPHDDEWLQPSSDYLDRLAVATYEDTGNGDPLSRSEAGQDGAGSAESRGEEGGNVHPDPSTVQPSAGSPPLTEGEKQLHDLMDRNAELDAKIFDKCQAFAAEILAPAPAKPVNMVDKQCKETVYITPPLILDPVRGYFGGQIGFDPATERTNPTLALEFMTEEEDGLSAPWHALELAHDPGVFVNPPYGKVLKLWVAKIAAEARAGAKILTILPGQRFEQAYIQENLFIPELTGWCFVRKRVNFLDRAGNKTGGNTYGSFIYLYNGDWPRFVHHFSPLGLCMRPAEIVQQNGGSWAA